MSRLLAIIFLALFFLIWGCGKSGEEKPEDEQTTEDDKGDDEKTGIKSLDDFVDEMKEFQQDLEEGKEVEPVDFRALKELLPEGVGPLARTSSSGEKTNSFGFYVSQAEGKYESEDKSNSITIKIVDLGNMKGWGSLADFGWTFADIDKETETGYEKTTKYKGHKAYEEYNLEYQNGKFEVLVVKRYMVTVEGDNVSMEIIKEAMDGIDLGALEDMKDAGVKESESE